MVNSVWQIERVKESSGFIARRIQAETGGIAQLVWGNQFVKYFVTGNNNLILQFILPTEVYL